ncbi:hypothetical protein [Escherichia coli]|uniref:hypothetical protein n=1 Tax=Escherichia coli TaxID=562 RepID=UPI0020752F3D|nr:hypothetical protein [Escherichia coli]
MSFRKKICRQLDVFINTELASAVNGNSNSKPLFHFLNNYLYHPKMIALIILSMLPYEVIRNDESLSEFKTPLTTPDEFIIKAFCVKGTQNTMGHKKDIEQLLRKTYIYIALLLNPEWVPSSKDLISFLSGESTEISGSMNFQSTSSGLGVQTNNITLLKNEVYFEKIANKIMKL